MKKEEIPPKLRFPTPEDVIPSKLIPDGSVPYKRSVLTITRVKGLDLEALFTNVLLMTLVFYILYVIIMNRTGIKAVAVTLPLIAVWAILWYGRNRLYTMVAARKGKLFQDPLTKTLHLYLKGFHFTRIYAREEPDNVMFMKDEIVIADKTSKEVAEKEIVFPTKGGRIDMLSELNLMFRLIEDADGLEHSLTYNVPEIKRRLRAHLSQHLAAIGALNSWQSILYYRSDVMRWLNASFAGKDKRSPVEIELGIDVQACNATLIDFTEESRQFVRLETLSDSFVEIVKKLMKEFPGMSEEDARIMAGAITGTMPKSTRVIEVSGKNLPPGLRALYAGDIPAVAGRS